MSCLVSSAMFQKMRQIHFRGAQKKIDCGTSVHPRIIQADPARMILLACEQANELADGENLCLFETEYVRHSIEIRSRLLLDDNVLV